MQKDKNLELPPGPMYFNGKVRFETQNDHYSKKGSTQKAQNRYARVG